MYKTTHHDLATSLSRAYTNLQRKPLLDYHYATDIF